MTDLEKPWYFSALSSFLMDDVPELVGLTSADFARDVQTCERRLAHEGESFLTKTLPAFGKVIDLALQRRQPLRTSAFKKKSKSSTLPAFLQGLLGRIFDEEGWVLEDPCAVSIRLVRQVCLWFKKVQKGFTDEVKRQASKELVDIDASLPLRGDLPRSGVLGTAKATVELILRDFPEMSKWMPKHGPGAVAGREGAVEKRWLLTSYKDLESVFRPIPWFFSLRDAACNPSFILDRPAQKVGWSRIEFVEKDSSGPRVIGLEPAEYMWCQQALKGALYDHIEKRSIAKGQINFTDQSKNRRLTKDWSTWSTLDMSKASDRNSLALVEELFENTAVLRPLLACRTPGAVLPDGSKILYRKFAPMGSAVCFPVEAIVFYALAVGSLVAQGVPYLIALHCVFVYGDDLVVPNGFFEQMSQHFESFGLKFNADKSCYSGKFRESCGMDAFDGFDVTPIRAKKVYPTKDPASLIPVIEHINNLMLKGYRHASTRLRRLALAQFPKLRSMKLGVFCRVDLPFLYWYDPQSRDHMPRGMYCDSIYHVRGLTFHPEKEKASVSMDWRLLRESLAHVGPVGSLRRSREKWVRELELRWRGRLSWDVHTIDGFGWTDPEAYITALEKQPELSGFLIKVPRQFSEIPAQCTWPMN